MRHLRGVVVVVVVTVPPPPVPVPVQRFVGDPGHKQLQFFPTNPSPGQRLEGQDAANAKHFLYLYEIIAYKARNIAGSIQSISR